VIGTNYNPTNILEGTEVSVWSGEKVHFIWKQTDENIIAFTLPGSKALVLLPSTDKRFIHFTNQGICIQNEASEVLLLRDYD
jgi:hypothetical protein